MEKGVKEASESGVLAGAQVDAQHVAVAAVQPELVGPAQRQPAAVAFSGSTIPGTATPLRMAVISARIAIAISGGVLAPSFNPTGPCRRAISCCDRSKSARRLRRASLFLREPIAPM